MKLITTNVANGTVVPYVVAGTGSAAGVTMAGEFTVQGNAAVAVVAVPTNNTYGDTGSFTVSLANGKGGSPSVTVTDSTAAPAVVNQTITLTSASEAKTGGAGNDTFLALNSGDLSNGDNIDGAGGADTIYAVFSTGGDATIIRPVMTSVETVQIEPVDADANGTTSTINLDKTSGVTLVSIKANNFSVLADTYVVSGVTTATSLKITDDAGHATARANNYTMSYDGVSGTSDSASVEISSTSAATALGNITEAGIENLTISSTGGANASYNVVAAAGKTLTLNASAASGGSVVLEAAAATTLNINAADSMTITDAGAASAALRTVNIDSQTAAKTVTLTNLTYTVDSAAADTFTYNVKGAGKTTLTLEDLDFGTQSATNSDSIIVNGSTATGALSVNLSSITNSHAARTINISSGSGNDTVTVIKTALDKYDTVALGGGTADRLSVSVTGNANADLFYTDTTAVADLPAISGVEIASVAIGTSSSSATLDATSAKFASTLELTGTQHASDTLAVSGIAAGQKVALGSSTAQFVNSAAITLNVVGATANTADVLNITTDIVNSTDTGTLSGITAAKIETVSVDLASSTTANTKIAGGTLTFADATSVILTGSKATSATVQAKTGATIDATGVTGTLTLTANDAKNYTVKGSATKATSFVMGSELNATDAVTGGAATTDSLTANVTGLTATTGKLSISGVETLKLANTGTAVVDATSITGATSVVIAGAATATTLTKLAAGVEVTLGDTLGSTATAYTGGLTVGLADASGTADSLTLNVAGLGTEGTTTLTTTGIENLNIKAATTYDAQTVDTGASTAATITASGGNTTTAVKLTLSTLNAATTLVDASAFNGGLLATAATNTPTTFKVRASADTILVGSVLNDTVVVGTAANQAAGDIAKSNSIDGGTGTDTLTVYAADGTDLRYSDNFEVVNVIVDAAANSSISLGGSGKGADDASSVVITGGAAGKTLALTGIASDLSAGRTVDASAVLSTTTLTLGDNVLVQTNASDPIVLKGGSATADVLAYTASNDNSGEVTISGFETIQVTNGDSASTLNLKNVTGTSAIELVGAGQMTLSNFSNTQKVVLGTYVGSTATAFSDGTGDSVSVSRATDGTADVLNVDLNQTAAFTLTDNQAETVNLTLVNTAGDDDHVVTLSSTSVTSVTVTGAGTAEDLALTATGALLTSVNASALAGSLTYDVSARASQAMTITGGTGADTIGMKYAADVIDAGAGTDTLNISTSGTGGALIIDLSSTTDQVQMFNGLSNAAVQKGFENVDASAYVQTNSVGADITGSSGANVLVGTAYADSFRAGAGNDSVTIGKASTTVAWDAADGEAGTDTLIVLGSVTTSTTESENVIDLSSTSDQVGTVNNAAEAAIQVGFENVDLSGLTVTAGGGFTITAAAAGSAIVGSADTDVINGGAGVDTITGGAGADTIGGGAGADVLVFANTDSVSTTSAFDTVTVGTGDIFDFTSAITAVTGSGTAVTVAAGSAGTATSMATLNTAIAAAITEVAGTAFLITVTDSGTGNALSGLFLAVCLDTTYSTNDILIKLVGTNVSADDTIAISGGNLVYTIV